MMINARTLKRFTRETIFLSLWGAKVFIHEYMDSWEKFEEARSPVKNAFYSKLNVNVLVIETTNMHSKFEILWKKYLRSHGIYLKTDVLLSLEHYKLDPVHFYKTSRLE